MASSWIEMTVLPGGFLKIFFFQVVFHIPWLWAVRFLCGFLLYNTVQCIIYNFVQNIRKGEILSLVLEPKLIINLPVVGTTSFSLLQFFIYVLFLCLPSSKLSLKSLIVIKYIWGGSDVKVYYKSFKDFGFIF